MKVIAAPGLKVSLEFKPREYVTDADVVEVPDVTYYHRRIIEGDLIDVEAAAAKAAAEAAAEVVVAEVETETKTKKGGK